MKASEIEPVPVAIEDLPTMDDDTLIEARSSMHYNVRIAVYALYDTLVIHAEALDRLDSRIGDRAQILAQALHDERSVVTEMKSRIGADE